MSEQQYQENLHFITSHPEAVARHVTAQDEKIDTLRAEVERLRALAHAVCFFDWSDNDDDAVLAIANLRAALRERT